MFLEKLNNEEKVMFLDMAMHVSKANGMIEESEKHMLDVYCKEMEIASYDKEDIHSTDEIKAVFSGASDAAKRIAVFELLGLGYIDGSRDELEIAVVKEFAAGIGITDEVFNSLNQDIEAYIKLIGSVQVHVFGA